MKFHHYLIAIIYPFKRLILFFKKFLFNVEPNELRVLLYHDIPQEKFNKFYQQLIILKKSWNFISPDEFSKIMDKKKKLKGRNLLLTFDDGYISNSLVAKNILDPLNIKAIFFVVLDFINIKNKRKAKEYVASNIYPSLKNEDVPNTYYNMNWTNLKELVNNGHTIGAHTKSHIRLSDIKNHNKLYDEIVMSTDIIEKKLNISIKYFAFPFGNKLSFSKDALLIAKKRFDFIFSGLRGDNNNTSKNYVLFRDSINIDFSKFLIGSFLEGNSDFYYKKSKYDMDRWII